MIDRHILAIFCVSVLLVPTATVGSLNGVYELQSTTRVLENSDDAHATLKPFESRSTLEINLIKEQPFNSLYSVKVLECHPIQCEDDYVNYFVSFENETIKGVYGKLGNTSEWSVGLSVISLLQPRLDVPRINVPGVCQSNNEIIDVNKRVREIKFCNYGTQHSILRTLDANSVYHQTVLYKQEDGLLKTVTVEESYSLSLPLYSKASTKVVSSHTLTLKSSETSSVSEICNSDLSVEACLKTKVEKLGYKFISENAEKLLTAYMFNRFTSDEVLDDTADCVIGSPKDFQKLNEYSEKSASKTFLRLVRNVEIAGEKQLLACLQQAENKPNLNTVASLYAASGTLEAYNAFKEFLSSNSSDSDNVQRLRDVYLNSLTHAPSVDRSVIVNVLKDFSESNPVDAVLAMTGAAILRRYCFKIAGCEDKSGPTKQLIANFETKFTECKSDDIECLRTLMRSFVNLRTPHVVRLVKPYLCTEQPLGLEVLRLLRVLHPSYWSNPDVIKQLWLIYNNRCTMLQGQTARTFAAELLLASYEDKRSVVQNIFKIASPGNFSVEKEILSYVSAKIKQLAKVDDRIEEALNELDSKSLYFNYVNLVNGAKSTALKGDLLELDSGKATYALEMDFYKGILKRSKFDIRLEPFDSSPSTLMTFGLFSDGLDSVASVLGSGDDANFEASSIEVVTPTAGMRLTLFENEQLPVTFFTGEGELMSAVWSATGDRMSAFEDNLKINDLKTALPLTSGYTLMISVQSALSMLISGSIEVSIWYRTSHSVVSDQRSFVLNGQMRLRSTNGVTAIRNDVNLASKFGVDVITDLDFYSNPFRMCLQLEQSPFSMKYKVSHKLLDVKNRSGKESLQNWHRSGVHRIDGRCFATLPSMAKSCNDLLLNQ